MIPGGATDSVILQGTLEYYEMDSGCWLSRYFTLLNDGNLQIYRSKEDLNCRLGVVSINPDVSVCKSEFTTNGQTLQTIQLDVKSGKYEAKPKNTIVLATRYKSVQEAWVQVLTRFASQNQASPARFKIYSSPIQFEGPLEKRGYWNPAWKARHFVLTEDGTLSYYPSLEDSRSVEPLGSFAVRNAVISLAAASAAGRAQFTVLVQDPACPSHGRTYAPAAAGDDLLRRWLRELERAARPGPPPSVAEAAPASSLAGGSGGEKDRAQRRSGSSRLPFTPSPLPPFPHSPSPPLRVQPC